MSVYRRKGISLQERSGSIMKDECLQEKRHKFTGKVWQHLLHTVTFDAKIKAFGN